MAALHQVPGLLRCSTTGLASVHTCSTQFQYNHCRGAYLHLLIKYSVKVVPIGIPIGTHWYLAFQNLPFQNIQYCAAANVMKCDVQVYPEKVAALPMQQLQTLLQTLEFGLNAPQSEAVQSALEALAALAKFDWQKKRTNQSSLAADPGLY